LTLVRSFVSSTIIIALVAIVFSDWDPQPLLRHRRLIS
jgi:hypothetical protein